MPPRSAESLFSLFALSAAALLCSMPVLNTFLPSAHDLGYLLYRIDGLAQGIASDHFPVWIQNSQIDGYGYAVGVSYPDLFLTPFALLHLAGLSVNTAFRLLVIAINVLTAIIAFVSFRRMTGSARVALCISLMWLFAPYRMENIALRADAGEALAMTFFPLIALGAYLLINRQEAWRNQPFYRNGWFVLGIGMSCLLLSHPPSILLVLLTGVPTALIIAIRNRRVGGFLVGVAKASALMLLLCAWFIVPFIDYYLNAHLYYTVNPMKMTRLHAAEHAAQPAQLFMLFPAMAGFSVGNLPGLHYGVMPAALGYALLFPAVAVAALLPIRGANGGIGPDRRFLLVVFLIASALTAFMATVLAPWNAPLGPLGNALFELLSKIQYPWRFIGLAEFFLLLTASFLLSDACVRPQARRVLAIMCIAFAIAECGMAITTFLSTAEPTSYEQIKAEKDGIFDAQFIPGTTDIEVLRSELGSYPRTSQGVTLLSLSRQGTKLDATVVNEGQASGYVALPLLLYRHIGIADQDESSGTCTIAQGSNGMATLNVPPGYRGNVTIDFLSPVIWQASGWLSIATFLFIVIAGGVMYVRSRRAFSIHQCNRVHIPGTQSAPCGGAETPLGAKERGSNEPS